MDWWHPNIAATGRDAMSRVRSGVGKPSRAPARTLWAHNPEKAVMSYPQETPIPNGASSPAGPSTTSTYLRGRLFQMRTHPPPPEV